jgi:hypothetical protein
MPMATTKITIKLIEQINTKLNEQLDASFMKRDKFIAHLISTQLPDLGKALEGRTLSPKAKQYIFSHLKRAGTKTVNLLVEQSLADQLNALVEKHNLMRDAVLNRIIFFAIATPSFYRKVEVPTNIETVTSQSTYLLTLPTSPMAAVQELLSDPLFYVKEAFEIAHGENIFTYDFSHLKFKGLNPLCFSCFIGESSVPGTKAHKEQQSQIEALLQEFLEMKLEAENA